MKFSLPRPKRRSASLRALAVLGVLGLGASACSHAGSGVEATQTRDLDGFDAIELGGVFELTVHVDPKVEQKIEIRGDDNLLDKVITKVHGDELTVGIERGFIRPKKPLEVEVWVPKLAELDASGASDIEVSGLHGERFELDISGAAEVSLSGTVDTFILDSSGASEVDAKQLQAKAVELDLSGAGEADVFASESLDVDLSGAGNVRYWGGAPEVTQDVSGAGKIEAK